MSKTAGLEKIAKRYAEALFSLTEANDEKTLTELKLVKEVFETNTELHSLLEHPGIDNANKSEIISKLFDKAVSEEVANVLQVLLNKGRMNIASLLFDYYKASFYQKRNIEVARVNSAKELSDAQLSEIKSKLESIFNKTLEVETNIDESLVAGVKVNVGQKVLDSSVKAKLKQMKQLLTQ